MNKTAELLTTAQVAELTGWPKTSINRWARKGDLPTAHKHEGIRGPRLFRREDIEARLRERQPAA